VKTDWLSRLQRAEPFVPLPGDSHPRPALSLGGLAAGMVPDAVRASHGYAPQFPSDVPQAPRLPRRGDFFRCE
jgi:hypothetical protein